MRDKQKELLFKNPASGVGTSIVVYALRNGTLKEIFRASGGDLSTEGLGRVTYKNVVPKLAQQIWQHDEDYVLKKGTLQQVQRSFYPAPGGGLSMKVMVDLPLRSL